MSDFWKRATAASIFLTIGLLAIWLVVGVSGNKTTPMIQPDVNPTIDPQIIKTERKPIQDQLAEYLNFKKLNIYPNELATPQTLIDACKDKAKVSDLCNKEIAKITKVFKVIEKPTKAYLYIKAGVSRNGEPFGVLTQYDSIWFFADDANHSGHILRDFKDAVIINREGEDGYTELLLDLSKIPVTQLPYNPKNEPSRLIDITNDILSVTGSHYFSAFVSTEGYGKIFNLKIGYDTGQLLLLRD